MKYFLLVFQVSSILMLGFGFIHAVSHPVMAASEGDIASDPNLFKDATPVEPNCDKSVSFGCSLPSYVKGFYNWSIGAGIALSILMLVYAGYNYMISGGDPSKVGFAKEIIIGSLAGLTLLAGAKLILNLLFT